MKDIGEKLKASREESGLSLEEVSEDLRISVSDIKNIEQGNKDAFLDNYALKKNIYDYAKYLGLDYEELIEEFNEFMFEKTSKIPVEEIEKKIMEKNKEEALLKSRIASPYTDTSYRYKKKSIAFLYLLVIALVALVIFWSVKQVTVGKMVTTTASQIEGR